MGRAPHDREWGLGSMTTLVTLEDAKRQGLVRYFTGERCNHGHVAERYVKGNRCVECDRMWRSPNPHKAQKAVRVPRAPVMASASTSLGFSEPKPWEWDGGKRREPVLDIDRHPPVAVRHVGWRCCMRCAKPFFSVDVLAIRICDGCKGASTANLG